jgi:hypothetical protein
MPNRPEHKWLSFLLLVTLGFTILPTTIFLKHNGEWKLPEMNAMGVGLAFLGLMLIVLRTEWTRVATRKEMIQAHHQTQGVVRDEAVEIKQAATQAVEQAAHLPTVNDNQAINDAVAKAREEFERTLVARLAELESRHDRHTSPPHGAEQGQ